MNTAIKAKASPSISDSFIGVICKRVENNQSVRRSLPVWGRVHIDRSLPFLCIYRRPIKDEAIGAEHVAMGEASYITAPGNRSLQKSLELLVHSIAKIQVINFGAFLVLEIWELTEDEISIEGPAYKPYFQIVRPLKTTLFSTIEILEAELKQVKYRGLFAGVDVVSSSKIFRPGLVSLMSAAKAAELGCHILGLKIRPIYRNKDSGEIFPLVRRSLHRRISKPLKRTFYEFIRSHTTHRPPHYTALGRRSVVKAVWDVDQALAEIGNQFDFLLQVTPTNIDSAWTIFKRNKCEKEPTFIYRRLPIDPILTKRRLFKIPVERIEDPVLAELFRCQQMKLDRKLTMLADRGTFRFRYGSVQLYGVISEELLNTSKEILAQQDSPSHYEIAGRYLDATSFALKATEELSRLREQFPNLNSTVEIHDEISGLMVSSGNLLIGRQVKIPLSRVQGLLQHEIGTHVVTYFNGRSQPFQQLYIGLAGYDELQEGLAVLAEYLVGALSPFRLRLLAARVLASEYMINGATFIDVFRELKDSFSFKQKTAFLIAVRTFRGGGLTKDSVYLRGLINLLEYLKNGGDYELLFMGKFAFNHISLIQELLWRKVLKPAPLRPSYLTNGEALSRLAHVRSGISINDLIERG